MDGIFLVLSALLALLLAGVCVLLYVLIIRTRNLEKQIHKQEAQSEQQHLSETLLASNRFQVMEERLGSISKDQVRYSALMSNISSQMSDISKVMSNSKLRGSWGEYQMETLIRTYCGNNPDIYEIQFRLDNQKIADGVFHLPDSDRLLCIDSKFPLDNYLKMEEFPEDAEYFQKELRKNVKKHIDDIAAKYITAQTVDYALLFIPSESLYQMICGSFDDLLHYALKKHVLPVSPTTLAGVIYSLQACTRDFYRAENMAVIEKELDEISTQFENLLEQANKTRKSLDVYVRQSSLLFKMIEQSAGSLHQALEGKDAGIKKTGIKKQDFLSSIQDFQSDGPDSNSALNQNVESE